ADGVRYRSRHCCLPALPISAFLLNRSSDRSEERFSRNAETAASDVRDEFVSVTEKLMDELAQCYNVLPQLDINNTIDHRPEGDRAKERHVRIEHLVLYRPTL